MDSHTAEVAVVGAGPAGSAAAALLARHGHTVRMIDRRRFPRDKACGDLLVGSTVKRLERLGLDDSLKGGVEVASTRWVGANGSSFEKAIPAKHRSVAIPRLTFDSGLSRLSEEAGASFHQGTARLLPAEDDRTRLLLVQPDSEPSYLVRASVILAADGGTSAVAGAAGAAPTDRSRSALAMRTYLPTSLPVSTMHLYEINDGGALAYGWAFPSPDSMVNIGLCGYGSSAGTGLRDRFDTFVHRFADEFDLDPDTAGRPMAGLIRFDFSPEQAAFGSVLAIGDAVGLGNPANGEGISFAIGSAEVAVDAVHRALEGDREALGQYGKSLRAEFGSILARGLANLDEEIIESNSMVNRQAEVTRDPRLTTPTAAPAVAFPTRVGSVLWPLEEGPPLLLTALGATLWRYCSGTVSLQQLARELTDLDSLPSVDWSSELQRFLQMLGRHRLIQPVSNNNGATQTEADPHSSLIFAQYRPPLTTRPRESRSPSHKGTVIQLTADDDVELAVAFDELKVPAALDQSGRVGHDAGSQAGRTLLTVSRASINAGTVRMTGPASTVFVGESDHEVLWAITTAMLPREFEDFKLIEATLIASQLSAVIMPLQPQLQTSHEMSHFTDRGLRSIHGQVLCNGTSVIVPSSAGVDAWLNETDSESVRSAQLGTVFPLAAAAIDVKRERELLTTIVIEKHEDQTSWTPVEGPELDTWVPERLASQLAALL